MMTILIGRQRRILNCLMLFDIKELMMRMNNREGDDERLLYSNQERFPTLFLDTITNA